MMNLQTCIIQLMRFRHDGVHEIILISLLLMLMTACVSGLDAGDSGSKQATGINSETGRSSNDLNARIETSAASILHAINVERAEASVPALICQPDLIDVAAMRAADLAVRSYLSHEDPDSGEVEVEQALARMGYSGPAAELLFATRDALDQIPLTVTEAWFADPMHKALLLEPSFRYCGIGVMGDGDVWRITIVLTVAHPEEVSP